MNEDYFDFAVVMDVQPPQQALRWEMLLRNATPASGIRVNVRQPSLAMFTVTAQTEWEAIDRAVDWLRHLADSARPPLQVSFNAQPSNEV